MESIPSKRDVNRAIYELEIGFWEANRMRGYYAGLRAKRWMAQPLFTFAGVTVSRWYPVQVAAAVIFVASALLWLAL